MALSAALTVLIHEYNLSQKCHFEYILVVGYWLFVLPPRILPDITGLIMIELACLLLLLSATIMTVSPFWMYH